MADKDLLAQGWSPHMQGAGNYQRWAEANPTEASALAAFVNSITANPTPPVFASDFGKALGYWAQMALPEPPPPPPPSQGWGFRGIYCVDANFSACLAALPTMGLNSIECQIYSGTTYLKARMDQIPAPYSGWAQIGSFSQSTTGGSFSVSDANCTAIVQSVVNHPRNSHRYYIADEPTLAGYTTAQQDANKNKLRARRDLIKASDPAAIVCLGHRPDVDVNLWVGVVDEVWITAYPNWTSTGYQEALIQDSAAAADTAGIPYLAVPSCHDYQTGRPAYPTPSVFAHSLSQWWKTNARGATLYIWDDGVAPSLSTDTAMQRFIGDTFALVS